MRIVVGVFFESTIVAGKGKWNPDWCRLGTAVPNNAFLFDDAFEPSPIPQVKGKSLESFFKNPYLVYSGARDTPLTPKRFNDELDHKFKHAEAKGVKLFTNGLEDMPLVKRKYADSYEQFTKSTFLFFEHCRWGPSELKVLSEVLRDCSRLIKLDLRENQIGNGGMGLLAKGLAGCRSLQELLIYGSGIDDADVWDLSEGLQCCPNLTMLSIGIASSGKEAKETLMAACPKGCNVY